MNKWNTANGPGGSGYGGDSSGIPDSALVLNLPQLQEGCFVNSVLAEGENIFIAVEHERENTHSVLSVRLTPDFRGYEFEWELVEKMNFDCGPVISLSDAYVYSELMVYKKNNGHKVLDVFDEVGGLIEFSPSYLYEEKLYRIIEIDGNNKLVSINLKSKEIQELACTLGNL